jgi:hypothetical protein
MAKLNQHKINSNHRHFSVYLIKDCYGVSEVPREFIWSMSIKLRDSAVLAKNYQLTNFARKQSAITLLTTRINIRYITSDDRTSTCGLHSYKQ